MTHGVFDVNRVTRGNADVNRSHEGFYVTFSLTRKKWLVEDEAERDVCRSECESGKRSLNRLQHKTLLLFQYLDVRFLVYTAG